MVKRVGGGGGFLFLLPAGRRSGVPCPSAAASPRIGQQSTRRLSSNPLQPQSPPAHEFADTARKVCATIRRQPRWEANLLSDFPPSHLFHPSCIRRVLPSLPPLLSLRFLLFLSSSSSPPNALPSSSLDSFLRRLSRNTTHIDAVFSALTQTTPSSFCPSLATWNTALNSSLRAGRTDLFWRLYHMMSTSTVTGDASTAGYLVQALCRERKPLDAYKLVLEASRNGLVPNVVFLTQLVSELVRIGNFSLVSELLHFMIAAGQPPDIVTYQVIIHGLFGRRMGDEGFRIFNEVKMRGYKLDSVVYSTVIDGLCKMGRMEEARRLWEEMVGSGMEPNEYTYNALVDGYCREGDFDTARKVYDEMCQRGYRESTVSCTTMMAGYCLYGNKIEEAMEAFNEMPGKGVKRDVVTYTALIQGLCKAGKTVEAGNVYKGLMAAGLQPNNLTYAPLIAALCEEGNANNALELMVDMQNRGLEPSVDTYSHIIAGFCKVGEADKGMVWLVKMLEKDLKPHAETVNSLVECLASHNRMDDALMVLNIMLKTGCTLEGSVGCLLVGKLIAQDCHHGMDLFKEILVTGD